MKGGKHGQKPKTPSAKPGSGKPVTGARNAGKKGGLAPKKGARRKPFGGSSSTGEE